MSSTKKWQTLFSVMVLFGLALSLAAPSGVQAKAPDQPTTGLKPTITYAERADLSPALRDVAPTFTEAPVEGGEQPLMLLPKALTGKVSTWADGALQNAPVTGQMPAMLANFDGVNNIAGVAPPDTEGDMGFDPATGTKYYVQWVNLHIQAWNVDDPAAPVSVLGPIAGNAIWTGFGGPCEANNDGDPIVLYDELAHRWFISQFSVSGPYYNCIAVSQSGDPTGSWYRYAFLYSNTKMNDYPKYGVWPDGYYMTVNQFNNASTWGGAGAAVYERDALLAGNPAARQIVFDLYSANANFGGMLPSDFEGTPPAAGTPNFFAEVDDTTFLGDAQDSLRLWEFHVDWANPANSSFGLSGQPNQVLPVADYTPLCLSTRACIPQPNSEKLDAIGDRLMYRLAYRVMDDGTQMLAVNHTVDAGSSRAGVRWYQLSAPAASTTFTLDQQGTYAGDNPASDTNHRWMGSIGIDRMGNLALGYSVSSGTVYPSVGLAGRLAADPVDTLPQGESIVFSGTTAQSGVPNNRWGDYSSMSIDPTDGCTFWYTTEYSSGGWNWRTRIVSFRYPTCVDQPFGTLTGTVTAQAGGLPISGAKINAGGFTTITDGAGVYTLLLPVGNYAVTASANFYSPLTVTDVAVVQNSVTTQNFSLLAANTRTVSGTVYDATPGGHAWPLYAAVEVTGFPTVYTDPLTGAFSVQLPENQTFAFNVSAVDPGYQAESRTVTVPLSDSTEDFGLLADLETCIAPGYQASKYFSENFDSVSAPNLPAGWASVKTGGSEAAAWATNAGSVHPASIPPVSQPNVAYFNSWTVHAGNQARLYQTAPISTPILENSVLRFWMFHDNQYPVNHDTLQAQISTNGGASWANVGPVFDRVSGTGWQSHSVDLNAFTGQTGVQFGFLATSAYGNDLHIDNVYVGTECVTVAGGMAIGQVRDANTLDALNGVLVESATGQSTVTAATPLDPALGDGFYSLFIPAGGVTLTASLLDYQTATRSFTLANGAVVWNDFTLEAGVVNAIPGEFHVKLPANSTTSATLVLSNSGGAAAQYQIAEINAPLTVIPVNSNQADQVRHVSPKRLNDPVIPEAHFPFPTASSPVWQNAGIINSSFDSNLAYPWGIGFNTNADDLWLGNIALAGGDDLNYRFLTNGTNTGDTIDTTPWVGYFGADMTYNPITGMLWQLDVGGDDCIHEMDPVTQVSTGRSICPPFGVSQRGLAYDPLTNTYFSGSWNDSTIRRFAADGTLLEGVNVAIPIAGLAYNPASGHLFVLENSDSLSAFRVLDVNNNYAEIGQFNVTGFNNNGGAGLEIACNGSLWAVNQTDKKIYEVTSDEGNVCDWMDIPWLNENPTSGTLLPGANGEITMTFNSAGMVPGIYHAQVIVQSNTPYNAGYLAVPVTLEVGPRIYLPVISK